MTPKQFKDEVFPLKDRLYRFACRILEDTEDARDMVQEVLVRLWDQKTDLRQVRSIEAYAMTMTRNVCIDWLRANGRILTDAPEIVMIDPVTPYDITEIRDTVKRINCLINHLPDQQRMIIHLRDIEGYDFDEIAAILGLNLNVIRVNLSRARKKIKEQLAKAHQYEFQRN
ncbi:MAG TPA: RNA polymerase sigma factor [Bacteroidales bacterium]|nr:RNA polymerase sigma factor [Bacteroidales bacterium]HNS47768.1 RNA polymerase sigma factor [Bacteroidales bacterium]